jgi:septin family protein
MERNERALIESFILILHFLLYLSATSQTLCCASRRRLLASTCHERIAANERRLFAEARRIAKELDQAKVPLEERSVEVEQASSAQLESLVQ